MIPPPTAPSMIIIWVSERSGFADWKKKRERWKGGREGEREADREVGGECER